MKPIFFLIIASLVAWSAWMIYKLPPEPKCIQSHEETRHREAYVTFNQLNGLPWTGKGVMIPVNHPAHDYQVTVCDKCQSNQ